MAQSPRVEGLGAGGRLRKRGLRLIGLEGLAKRPCDTNAYSDATCAPVEAAVESEGTPLKRLLLANKQLRQEAAELKEKLEASERARRAATSARAQLADLVRSNLDDTPRLLLNWAQRGAGMRAAIHKDAFFYCLERRMYQLIQVDANE